MIKRLNGRARGVLLALVVGAVLTACGTTLDITKVEKKISTGYEKQDVGAKVKSVTCPNSAQDLKKGSSFKCALVLNDDSKGEVTVKVTSDNGDIRWDVTKNARNVIDVTKVVAEITKGIEAQVTGAKVKAIKCPKAISGTKGAKTICSWALQDGSSGEITVTATDNNGTISWEITKTN